MKKLRFLLDESANKFKPGDWINGIDEEGNEYNGIFIASIDKDTDIIATWDRVGKIRRKSYINIFESKTVEKPEDAPKDIKKFAKNHNLWV